MQHKGTATLTTPRLTLRRFEPADAEAMFANWANDPEVTRFLTWQPHKDVNESRELIERWVKSYEDPSYYQWAIVLTETGEPVGSISAVRFTNGDLCPEIGYCIGQHWWNQGITSEALRAVIDFFFGEVGVARIAAYHDVDNPRSGGVMRHCGMNYIGRERRS